MWIWECDVQPYVVFCHIIFCFFVFFCFCFTSFFSYLTFLNIAVNSSVINSMSFEMHRTSSPHQIFQIYHYLFDRYQNQQTLEATLL